MAKRIDQPTEPHYGLMVKTPKSKWHDDKFAVCTSVDDATYIAEALLRYGFQAKGTYTNARGNEMIVWPSGQRF